MITEKKKVTHLFKFLTLITTSVYVVWNYEILAVLSQNASITMHEKGCTNEELKRNIEAIKLLKGNENRDPSESIGGAFSSLESCGLKSIPQLLIISKLEDETVADIAMEGVAKIGLSNQKKSKELIVSELIAFLREANYDSRGQLSQQRRASEAIISLSQEATLDLIKELRKSDPISAEVLLSYSFNGAHLPRGKQTSYCPKKIFSSYEQELNRLYADGKDVQFARVSSILRYLPFCGVKSIPMVKNGLRTSIARGYKNIHYGYFQVSRIGKDAESITPEIMSIIKSKGSGTCDAIWSLGNIQKGTGKSPELRNLFKELSKAKGDDRSVYCPSMLMVALLKVGEIDFISPHIIEFIKQTKTISHSEGLIELLGESASENRYLTENLLKILKDKNSSSIESRVSAALALYAIKASSKDMTSVLDEILKNETDSTLLLSAALIGLNANCDRKLITSALLKSVYNQSSVSWSNDGEYVDADSLRTLQLAVVTTAQREKLAIQELNTIVPDLVNIFKKSMLVDEHHYDRRFERKRASDVLGAIRPQEKEVVSELINIARKEALFYQQIIEDDKSREDADKHLENFIDATTVLGELGNNVKLAIPESIYLTVEKLMLQGFLSDDNEFRGNDPMQTAIHSAQFLGQVGDTEHATDYLLKSVERNNSFQLKQPFWRSRKVNRIERIGSSFHKIGESAIPFLIKNLRNPDIKRQRAAAYGLASIGRLSSSSSSSLITIVNDDSQDLDVRRLLSYALENSDIDVQSFFGETGFIPPGEAICNEQPPDYFNVYAGVCVSSPKDGAAFLLEWLKQRLDKK
jgi:hypothetical protein